jgi:ubiquinone/menaquinone biosynthesis C-methylase UbiE
MCRVLRPGGRLLVLEFSKVAAPLLQSPTTSIRSSCCR